VSRLVALLPFLAACQMYANSPQTVSLRVKGDVADAEVTIDDIPIGALGYVAAHGVALPPGKHRITVEKTGFFPWDGVVEAKEEPINVQIHMEPIPD
jgi:hypothetical protein